MMAYLLTDTGEYRQLPCPGVITIGRGTESSIRPESQSVSKLHARISLDYIHPTNKMNISIEDMQSRNGTFVGESPLDLEKLIGSRKLHFGDYMRFGFSQKLFRLVDHIQEDADDEIIVSPVKPVASMSIVPGISSSLDIDKTNLYPTSQNPDLINSLNLSLRSPKLSIPPFIPPHVVPSVNSAPILGSSNAMTGTALPIISQSINSSGGYGSMLNTSIDNANQNSINSFAAIPEDSNNIIAQEGGGNNSMGIQRSNTTPQLPLISQPTTITNTISNTISNTTTSNQPHVNFTLPQASPASSIQPLPIHSSTNPLPTNPEMTTTMTMSTEGVASETTILPLFVKYPYTMYTLPYFTQYQQLIQPWLDTMFVSLPTDYLISPSAHTIFQEPVVQYYLQHLFTFDPEQDLKEEDEKRNKIIDTNNTSISAIMTQNHQRKQGPKPPISLNELFTLQVPQFPQYMQQIEAQMSKEYQDSICMEFVLDDMLHDARRNEEEQQQQLHQQQRSPQGNMMNRSSMMHASNTRQILSDSRQIQQGNTNGYIELVGDMVVVSNDLMQLALLAYHSTISSSDGIPSSLNANALMTKQTTTSTKQIDLLIYQEIMQYLKTLLTKLQLLQSTSLLDVLGHISFPAAAVKDITVDEAEEKKESTASARKKKDKDSATALEMLPSSAPPKTISSTLSTLIHLTEQWIVLQYEYFIQSQHSVVLSDHALFSLFFLSMVYTSQQIYQLYVWILLCGYLMQNCYLTYLQQYHAEYVPLNGQEGGEMSGTWLGLSSSESEEEEDHEEDSEEDKRGKDQPRTSGKQPSGKGAGRADTNNSNTMKGIIMNGSGDVKGATSSSMNSTKTKSEKAMKQQRKKHKKLLKDFAKLLTHSQALTADPMMNQSMMNPLATHTATSFTGTGDGGMLPNGTNGFGRSMGNGMGNDMGNRMPNMNGMNGMNGTNDLRNKNTTLGVAGGNNTNSSKHKDKTFSSSSGMPPSLQREDIQQFFTKLRHFESKLATKRYNK